MDSLCSDLGSFELIENTGPTSKSCAHGTFKPEYWHSYPFSNGDDLKESPWKRPKQIPTSFVRVNLIDVETSSVRENVTVKISAGLIQSVEKAKAVDMQEEGWTSVDCRGLFMCPGLIDCEFENLVKAEIRPYAHS
jgi:hypothetical protein